MINVAILMNKRAERVVGFLRKILKPPSLLLAARLPNDVNHEENELDDAFILASRGFLSY